MGDFQFAKGLLEVGEHIRGAPVCWGTPKWRVDGKIWTIRKIRRFGGVSPIFGNKQVNHWTGFEGQKESDTSHWLWENPWETLHIFPEKSLSHPNESDRTRRNGQRFWASTPAASESVELGSLVLFFWLQNAHLNIFIHPQIPFRTFRNINWITGKNPGKLVYWGWEKMWRKLWIDHHPEVDREYVVSSLKDIPIFSPMFLFLDIFHVFSISTPGWPWLNKSFKWWPLAISEALAMTWGGDAGWNHG